MRISRNTTLTMMNTVITDCNSRFRIYRTIQASPFRSAISHQPFLRYLKRADD